MHKGMAILFIIGGLILTWFQFHISFATAHIHLDWVCESGNNIITPQSPELEIAKFKEACEMLGGKLIEIKQSISNSMIYSIVLSIILICYGVKSLIKNSK